jgi:hypothetical protein
MTAPRRLLEEGTEFERDLLASAGLDVGTDQGRQRAGLAMGAAVLSATTSTTSAAAGVAMGGATTGVLVKWVGLAVVTLGVAGASVRIGQTLSSGRHPRMAAPTAAVAVGPQHAATRGPGRAPELSRDSSGPRPDPSPPAVFAAASPVAVLGATAAPSQLECSRPKAGASAPRPAANAASPSNLEPPSVNLAPASPALPPDLQAEVSALGKARAALGRRDGQTALEALDAYEQAFPTGLLADEATVLRVDALALHGAPTEAAALGRRYLSAHPTSPYGTHLRAVIDGEHNP